MSWRSIPISTGISSRAYYRCGTLPEIDLNYNYIVQDTFVEYAGELRSLGYMELRYPNYSLFISVQK